MNLHNYFTLIERCCIYFSRGYLFSFYKMRFCYLKNVALFFLAVSFVRGQSGDELPGAPTSM